MVVTTGTICARVRGGWVPESCHSIGGSSRPGRQSIDFPLNPDSDPWVPGLVAVIHPLFDPLSKVWEGDSGSEHLFPAKLYIQ